MKRIILFLMSLTVVSVFTSAQELIRLYSGAIPGSTGSTIKEPPGTKPTPGMISLVLDPELEIYLPEKEKATGAAVIICPGGSYKVLTYQAEGVRTAQEFARNGIAAFVLKYRLPDDATMKDKKTGPLQDAQQAIKVVRENAGKWGIDINRVGIAGFSAGGHLASTAATHFEKSLIDNPGKINLRPDFLILVYPVISMQDNLTHPDSRTNLLGPSPSKEVIDLFSNEMQVSDNTPPTYIIHAADDKLVDVDNSILFFEALRHHNVPVEMHIFPKGGHGFVLRQKPEEWMLPLFSWMKNLKIILN
ncbi:MAG TPA: alpha/beta hydrolase [Bacteroidales bacterium]|nr:alpha/beta hydrolase [Bacteroidales bacterium]